MFAFYVFIIAFHFHLSIHFLKNDKNNSKIYKLLTNCDKRAENMRDYVCKKTEHQLFFSKENAVWRMTEMFYE